MTSIDFTLIGDGSSDSMLMPVLKWLLEQHFPETPINGRYGDLRVVIPPKTPLSERICKAIELYPCNLLFIHRDAEKEQPTKRYDEIVTAIKAAECEIPKNIAVVPVRMSEAWLLIDLQAIRNASGNPNGKIALSLPSLNKLEDLPDPKKDLVELLTKASELSKRRLKGFKPRSIIHRLASNIEDYSRLRQLQSFQLLEKDVENLRLSSRSPQF